MKLVVFDFCETLTLCQTSDKYLFYIIQRNNKYLAFIVKYFYKFRLLKKVRRNLLLRLIRNFKKNNNLINDYINEVILENINVKVLEVLKKYNDDDNCQTMILSAGFKEYIEKSDINVDFIIAADLEVINNTYTGFYTGSTCYKYEKAYELLKFLKTNNYKSVIFYTDCLSDLPTINICDENYIVNKNQIKKYI